MGDAQARRRLAPSAPRGGPEATGEQAAAGEHLFTRKFERADISELRHAVAHCAGATGLTDRPLEDFVLAVNELVTNAVRHGGGEGLLRLWVDAGRLVCEISDDGGGITGPSVDGHFKPAPNVVGGWGLWLARQLSETMSVTTGLAGTVVRISTSLPGRGGRDPGDRGPAGAAAAD